MRVLFSVLQDFCKGGLGLNTVSVRSVKGCYEVIRFEKVHGCDHVL